MKKRISILLVLVLLLAVIPAAARAEISRGSSGEEVISLQMMLFDMGYLFAEPDGQFGKMTEEAVKEYQRSAGLEETGVVTDELMGAICQDWAEYQAWIYEQLSVDAGGDYVPFCYSWEDENGAMITEHCQNHTLLWNATVEMLGYGDADSALHSYYEWQAEVISMYNRWIDLVSEPAKAEIETSKTLCIQLMEAQLNAMKASAMDMDPSEVYYGAELWMRNHCAWLCQQLNILNAE